MSVKRPCKVSSDFFCYVCGYYISKRQKKHKVIPETEFFIAYEAYFGMKMNDQDKSWAPHFCCGSCRSTLEGWMRGSRKCMPFAIHESGENLPIIMMTVISAWWTFPHTKRQRTEKRLFIQVFLHPLRSIVNHGPELPIPQPPTLNLQQCYIINLIGR